jgi:hypothetical protein
MLTEAAQTAAKRRADAAAIAMVGDRENDIYQAFTRRPDRVDLITRARRPQARRRRPSVRDGGLLESGPKGRMGCGKQVWVDAVRSDGRAIRLASKQRATPIRRFASPSQLTGEGVRAKILDA